MRTTPTHIYFYDGFMSNWHPAPVYVPISLVTPGAVGDMRLTDSEQLFMVYKAMHFNDTITAAKIVESTHPGTAKKLGREIQGFDKSEWDKVCYGAMVNAVQIKFRQNHDLRKQLTEWTAGRILVEASPSDCIWGVGLTEDNDDILDEKKWRGTNLLGKALMEVRTGFTGGLSILAE